MYGAESLSIQAQKVGLAAGALAQQNAYTNSPVPESQSAALLNRLARAVSCLRENSSAASAAVDKIVGPRPTEGGAAEKNPPALGFLGALEMSISEMEQLNAALNANLQRILSTF